MSYKHAYIEYYTLSCSKVQPIEGKPVGCLQCSRRKMSLGLKRNKSYLEAEWMVRTGELWISIPVPSPFNSRGD